MAAKQKTTANTANTVEVKLTTSDEVMIVQMALESVEGCFNDPDWCRDNGVREPEKLPKVPELQKCDKLAAEIAKTLHGTRRTEKCSAVLVLERHGYFDLPEKIAYEVDCLTTSDLDRDGAREDVERGLPLDTYTTRQMDALCEEIKQRGRTYLATVQRVVKKIERAIEKLPEGDYSHLETDDELDDGEE